MAESTDNTSPGPIAFTTGNTDPPIYPNLDYKPPSAEFINAITGNGTPPSSSVSLYDPSTWGNSGGATYMGGDGAVGSQSPTPQNSGFASPGVSKQGGGSAAGGCGCTPPDKSPSASASNGGKGSDIAAGENFDCYVQRIGDDGLLDDARLLVGGKIINTAITANALHQVDTTFIFQPLPGEFGQYPSANIWEIEYDGDGPVPGLAFDKQRGTLKGTVAPEGLDKTYKIKIIAKKDTAELDSRSYTFFSAAQPSTGDKISLVQPYVPSSGAAKITSGFGLRRHPITAVTKLHKGQDWVAVSAEAKGKGKIVAAADGTVSGVGNDASGYGKNIKITHQDSKGKTLCVTLYGHLSEILVTSGQVVTAGQIIGKEGSTGASTGPHLHFEVRLGGTVPVDPTPYLNGQVVETPPASPTGSQPSDKVTNNTAPAMTSGEVGARTGASCPAVIDGGSPNGDGDTDNRSPTSSNCAPDVRPSLEVVKKEIARGFEWWNAKYAGNPAKQLTEEDKNIILFIAKIESNFDPWAKNPTSSATGLYQMLDRTAEAYFKEEIVEARLPLPTGSVIATCENRGDSFLSTIAMAKFYTSEMRKYWDTYISSGKTSIAGMTIKNTPHSARYNTLTKAEFIYGLIHHDGVGNAVNGIDKGGVAYYRSRA